MSLPQAAHRTRVNLSRSSFSNVKVLFLQFLHPINVIVQTAAAFGLSNAKNTTLSWLSKSVSYYVNLLLVYASKEHVSLPLLLAFALCRSPFAFCNLARVLNAHRLN
jgi:hypothetical protein